jgi:hypothetical protein
MRVIAVLTAMALIEAVCVWAVWDRQCPVADKIVSVFVGTAFLMVMGIVVYARVLGRE